MKAVNIASYVLFSGVAAASVRETTRLLRRYPGRALRSYRNALAGFYGSAVLGIIGNYILQEMLFPQRLPGTAHATAAWVFALLSLPLTIFALDAFADAFFAWSGKRHPPVWRIVYFCFQAVFFVSFLAAGPRIFTGAAAEGGGVADVLVAGLEGANRLYPAVLAAAFALILSRTSSSPVSKGLTAFAILYAVLFFSGFVLLRVLSPGPGQRAFQSAFAFLVHPMPIFVLGRALKLGGPTGPSEANAVGPAAAALARFGIWERETEIVRLLLEGKTYREIESKLFISIKTVKTHVYNIYRKTGVKSRWQLMTLLRDGRKGSPEA